MSLTREGRKLAPNFRLSDARSADGKALFRFTDDNAGVALLMSWSAEDGVIASRATLANTGHAPVIVEALRSLVLPLPDWARTLTHYSGRWAGEMREERLPLPHGAIGGASRGGRPGFGGANWVRLEEDRAGETYGRVLAAHLAWSGDHETWIERDADGRATLLMGARLDPGEIVLRPSERFETPRGLFALSGAGRSAVRRAFHRAALAASPRTSAPRKVHLNSWEALGFGLDLPRLKALVADAAALGVERFVLDDGWFKERRNDRSSLGDWTPDPALFPQGLQPLIDHVHAHGLDFGLWVEPEMVSPDSDLYRAHPDWCLHEPGAPRPTQRHQLVLDLTRTEVTDYLFAALDRLLRDNAIAYLKWDHNRDLFPTAGRAYAQTRVLYALLDRLRQAHPGVEIESCASGGGRVDFEILRRCSRYWASDNNDAIERLRINRGWLQFLPLAMTGNHVGPSPNPITGRRLAMDFRAKVAVFGHMGVEADPAAMTPEERACLAQHIAVYKDWRDVTHGGALLELNHPDPGVFGWQAVGATRSLALVAQTQFAADFNASPVCLSGLAPERRYRVRLLEPWPERVGRYLARPDRWREGLVLSGRALAEAGLALPLHLPETAWLIAIEDVT